VGKSPTLEQSSLTLTFYNKLNKSSEGPVNKEVPVSAITLHPPNPLHKPTSSPLINMLSAYNNQ